MIKLFVTLETLAFAARERMREEKGATAVEYGLMVALIAVVILITVQALGVSLNDAFVAVEDAVDAVTP
jgi:pilus assembly protein Flp/PilA